MRIIVVAGFASLLVLAGSVGAGEVNMDDVYGCWRNSKTPEADQKAFADLCFNQNSNVVYNVYPDGEKVGTSEGYEYTVADENVIFIKQDRGIPWGICKINAESTPSPIELSCDETGKKYSGTWTKRCAKMNADGTDCL
jgi:hypothetical protein